MRAIAKDSTRTDPAGCYCPACLARTAREGDHCGACDQSRPDGGWPIDPLLGRLIKSRYRLLERLGAGGFGLVFRAIQVQGELELGEVVVKLLLPEKCVDAESRRRFINEARAARRVRSPHVVKVFDLDFDDGQPFLVMEYLHGESLQRVLEKEGALPPPRALWLALQVAGALDECHAAGIVHRDLKPGNLILVGRGEDFVKVLDFGVARVPSARAASTRSPLGTPRYMAPEQIRAEPLDGGADIFALGVILYECLAGAPPIDADTPDAYWRLNIDASPTPIRERCAELPESLERLLGRMMAKRRAERPPSMADVEQRLRAIGVAEGWLPDEDGGCRVDSSTVDRSPARVARPRRSLALLAMTVLTIASLTALALVASRRREPVRPLVAVPCALPGTAATRPAPSAVPTPAPRTPSSTPTLASRPSTRPAGALSRETARPKRARPRAPLPRPAGDEWGRAVGGL
jgi:serine/threonine protein kinase